MVGISAPTINWLFNSVPDVHLISVWRHVTVGKLSSIIEPFESRELLEGETRAATVKCRL